MMTSWSMIRIRITGKPEIRNVGDAVRLEGHYPNPEKGMRFFAGVVIVALFSIVSAPALYYGSPASAPQRLGDIPAAIVSGIPAALAPLVEFARTWNTGETPPDLYGWGIGFAMAFVLLMFGSVIAHLWRDMTDRPYLAVTVSGEKLSVQRGLFGTPVEIPRDECRAVHVGRRRSGTYEVLVQHGDTLTQVAIVTGNERRALLLKAKIDAMLREHDGGSHERSRNRRAA